MPLLSRDYQKLLDIIDLAYSIPNKAEMFKAFCEQLQTFVPICSAAYIAANRKTKAFQVQGSLVFRAPFQPMRAFAAYYAPLHPYIAATSHEPTKHLNRVVPITDIVPASRLPETEYGCDFQPTVPIFYELSAWPGSQGDLIGGMGFHRQKQDRDFTQREKEIVSRLVPHLARALHLIDLRQEVPDPDVGVIVMSADGTTCYLNDEAKRVLRGLSLGTIPIPGVGAKPTFFWTGTGVYKVVTVPATSDKQENTVLLEPQPSSEAISAKLEAHSLTPRQREIALLVIRGLSNREIAERLFIEEQTVKDHLRDVFEAVKIHRRSELTAKILGLSL
jgi:DNA-binding CsgD family transcriptional regulator